MNSAEIVLGCFDYQSDRDCTARMVQPKRMETTMLVAIGKGIELEVDVTRLNTEVRDHVMRTGLRNLLMDAHASATTKSDPPGYVQKSREFAEQKLASLYVRLIARPFLQVIASMAFRPASISAASRPSQPPHGSATG